MKVNEGRVTSALPLSGMVKSVVALVRLVLYAVLMYGIKIPFCNAKDFIRIALMPPSVTLLPPPKKIIINK